MIPAPMAALRSTSPANRNGKEPRVISVRRGWHMKARTWRWIGSPKARHLSQLENFPTFQIQVIGAPEARDGMRPYPGRVHAQHFANHVSRRIRPAAVLHNVE